MRTGPGESPTHSEIGASTRTWRRPASTSTAYALSSSGGREAIWGNEGTASLEAEVLRDGDLVGFVPEIPGSGDFSDAEVVDAIARADYSEPEGHERASAPPPGPALRREGGLFRRFRDGFRYDSAS